MIFLPNNYGADTNQGVRITEMKIFFSVAVQFFVTQALLVKEKTLI